MMERNAAAAADGDYVFCCRKLKQLPLQKQG
jgi:hypothetical protein